MTTQRKAKDSGKKLPKKGKKAPSAKNSTQESKSNLLTTTNSIATDNGDIIYKDSKIIIPNEKLKSILSKTYEKARSDAQKFHLYDHWPACFSFAFTSSIPLWTANFHDFWGISSSALKNLVTFLSLGSLFFGIVLLLYSVSCKSNKDDEHLERDKTVDETIQDLRLQAVHQ